MLIGQARISVLVRFICMTQLNGYVGAALRSIEIRRKWVKDMEVGFGITRL